VLRLQKVTQKSLSDIRWSLMNSAPVVEVELFEGDYHSCAKMLRALMSCIREFSLASRIYELPEGETIETCTCVNRFEISPTVLENILSEADSELGEYHGE